MFPAAARPASFARRGGADHFGPEARQVKRILIIPLSLLAIASACSGLAAAEESFYVKISGGGSYPILPNLSNELALQGDESPGIGYSAAFSFGRSFFEKRWAAEAYFSVSRHPSFRYKNGYEDFSANVGYYGFYLLVKKCLRPESVSFVPYIGGGVGYGRMNLTSGAAKLDGFACIVTAEVEHRIRDNMCLFAEGALNVLPFVEPYSSPFLEESDNDAILDWMERPLEDTFNSFELRLGIRIRLMPPKSY